jgi:hypothetical protein
MQQAVGSTTTNITSDTKQEMTVDPRGFGKIMSMFSNQYSDRALAVVREYFCNGDDSRMTAGSDRPTEVFLPTDLNPEILIRDYGTGLDKVGLTTVFSTYTFSTKDDENNSTGGLGIGSKVAFTLGRQFTVTGFKDGVKTTVLFALNDRGVGEWDVRYEGPTDEPNGVLVSVGVPDVAAMREAAERFFLTVPQGRALVDGQPPKHLSEVHEFARFNDEVLLVKDGEGQVRLQMGPVTYRVGKSILRAVEARLEGLGSQQVAQSLLAWDQSSSVLMEVPMGSVDIAPSREDLIDTDPTVNTVTSVVQGIHDYIVHDVQRQIDTAPTRFAAMHALHESMDNLKGFKVSKKAFTYGGIDKPFKNEVEVEAPTIFSSQYWSGRGYKTKIVEDSKHTVDFGRIAKTLVVAGVDAVDVSKVKRYAKRFIEESEFDWIVVTPDLTGAVGWFEWGIENGATTWSLDDYRAALRTMRDSNPRTASEPSYSVAWWGKAERELEERELLTDIIGWGKDLVLFEESARVNSEILALVEDKYTPVILLPQQSEAALRKRVAADGSVSIVEHDWEGEARAEIVKTVQAEVPEPTNDERIALGAAEWIASQRGAYGRRKIWSEELVAAFGGLPTPIQHPVLQEMSDALELAALLAEDLTEERQEALARLERWTDVEFDAIPYGEEFSRPEDVFPLLMDSYRNLQVDKIRKDPVYRTEALAYINSKA